MFEILLTWGFKYIFPYIFKNNWNLMQKAALKIISVTAKKKNNCRIPMIFGILFCFVDLFWVCSAWTDIFHMCFRFIFYSYVLSTVKIVKISSMNFIFGIFYGFSLLFYFQITILISVIQLEIVYWTEYSKLVVEFVTMGNQM